MISGQAGQWIGQWANVPVYIMTDTSLGTGAVGGAIASVEAFGKRAGELARLILTGAAPASLPFEIRTDSVPIFDWRALKRWGIPESRLPPASVVRFKPLSMWEQNRWYIIGALGIIGIQAAIITGLLKQRRRLRRTETELSESRQFMDLATDAGGIGLWVRDLVGERFWGNPRLRSLFGFGEADPLGIDEILARIHPDDREWVRALVQREQEDDPQFDVEFRTAEREGAPNRWLAARGRVVRGPHGKPLRRMGTVIDISERKEAEDALQKERRFLRQVIDINPNFIFAKDRAGRFTLANRAVADAYGTTVENLMGKTDADFNASAEEVEFFHQMDLEVMATLQERFILEERITDARGKVRWLQTVKRPIVGTDGAANQVLGTSTDITQRKVAELELRQQREDLAHLTRVSNMGELAASLAHELNQPLTAILSNSQAAQRFLSNKPSAIEEVREILHDIVEDTNRASEVIRRLRALSRKQAVAFDRVDLPGTIREITMLLHSDAVLRNVRVSLEADSDLPPVRGDKIQLQQVLLNLMLNAFDAMKECPEENREVLLRAGSNGTDTVEVSVADHGPGLATDELDRLFQPFFTTKRDGLGMGLSICRSIIENHRGRLWAENNRDGGATFFFTVPVDRDAAE
jgi:PAS domain S-box-containing protein